MAVVLAWLRLDLPRRWRSLAVLALLTAIASGTVMTALAASRRGASALERLSARTLPATSAILANQAGFDWGPVEALPEVESLTRFVVDYAWNIEGIPGNPGSFPPGDDATMRTIEKPVVFKGRVFDPARVDEAVVSRQFVSHNHKSVGDTVVVVLASPQELIDEAPGPGGTFSGPRIKVHIVGVVESPWFGNTPGGSGTFVLSPAVVAKYPANTVGDQSDPENNQFVNALVRLKGGEAAIPQLRKDVERITGRHDIDIWNLPDQLRSAQHQIAFESRCLVAFAIAAFIAALFLVGQAIVRYAAASTAELQMLRALGMSPRQVVRTAMAGPAIVGVIGAVLGGLGAIIASRWFPFGTADLLEPSPGTSLDWVVLGPGPVAVVVLVAGGAAAAAALALSAARRSGAARRSTLAAAVGRGGFPVPVVVGTRFALEAGRGRTAVPVRPALIGAVTGVLGILAAFTFSHGVTDAAAHPERFGQTFQYAAFVGINGHDFGPADKLARVLTANNDVEGYDDARTAVATG
ncbi:MAG: FtsX-like permease family protein, partial [Pseudonocardiales bacterium]